MTSFRATMLSAAMAVGIGAATLTASPAFAAEVCDTWAQVDAGNYFVQNNKWGTSATQCIDVNTSGPDFKITKQEGTGNTSGAPVSYPAVVLGCHYTKCSAGMPNPVQVSKIGSIPSSISYTYVSGATYDAAYDIWLDPTAKKDGVNQMEIMIWLNRQGSIQPIGSKSATANIAGVNWEVWTGNNGGNDVVSYLAPSAISSLSFDTMAFIKDTDARTRVDSSWYLTSIQAGFEPWIGGAGLAVNSFSASVNSGNYSSQSTTTTTTSNNNQTTTKTTTTTTSNNNGGGCKATYKTAGSWNGGFQGEVTVSGASNGWKLTINMPSGASIASLWGGDKVGSSGTVTVTNLAWNATGGTVGFVANGSGTPTVSCS